MSVLNQSGEEQVECPLCMEALEVDDLNFFPCTCGYQICRFCWHRIRTDENGLCPACRKAYSENPADFTPLSKEQVAQLKAEKRQKDQQRKAKLSESRKHLASVRVVQKNLVFVVGLPMRLADAEVLKKHEYFGKFGKIHKVVINQSTSYAGSQGPSASAYVTYMKSDDALRAIQSVNNIFIDGRQVKSSLGTTKYCSHFMKNQPCPKPDCMYLHDFGDPEASFTKEQMHAGKHQEYEKKLHEALNQRTEKQQQQQLLQLQQSTQNTTQAELQSSSSSSSVCLLKSSSQSTAKSKDVERSGVNGSAGGGRDSWPQLSDREKTTNTQPEHNGKKTEAKQPDKQQQQQQQQNGGAESKQQQQQNGGGKGGKNKAKSGTDVQQRQQRLDRDNSKLKHNAGSEAVKLQQPSETNNNINTNGKESKAVVHNLNSNNNTNVSTNGIEKNIMQSSSTKGQGMVNLSTSSDSSLSPPLPHQQQQQELMNLNSSGSCRNLAPMLDDNSSFFSQNSFLTKVSSSSASTVDVSSSGGQPTDLDDDLEIESHTIENGDLGTFADALPEISSSEDWEAAFGFAKRPSIQSSQSQIAASVLQAPSQNDCGVLDSTFGNAFTSPPQQITSTNNRLLDQGYSNNSNKLVDMFGSTSINGNGFGLHNKSGYDVMNESLLEVLTKNSLPFGQQHNQQQQQLYKSPSSLLDERLIPYGISSPHNLSSHNGLSDHQNMSKLLEGMYGKNGTTHQHKDTMLFGGGHGLNGLNGTVLPPQQQLNGLSNGLNGLSHHLPHPQVQQQQQQASVLNNGSGSYLSLEDKHALLAMQHQRQITEQLMNLNLQHKHQQQQQHQAYNGLLPSSSSSSSLYLNGGDALVNGSTPVVSSQPQQPYSSSSSSLFGAGILPSSKVSGVRNPEEELDFDPILETQKAFAEIIQNEQQQQQQQQQQQHNSTNRSNHVQNGLIHNQNQSNTSSSHCPPPPGFVQSNNTHLNINNTFGSKILPFLNLSSQQQQLTNNHQSNNQHQSNWPSNFGQITQQQQQQQQHQQPHKSAIGVCNDWKLIDPAIVRSTKQVSFPLTSVPLRDQLGPLQLGGMGLGQQPQQQQQHNPNNAGPFDSFAGFPGFGQQPNQQQTHFGYQTPPQVSQLSSWLNGGGAGQQITSPPGFRASQPSQGKQQEC